MVQEEGARCGAGRERRLLIQAATATATATAASARANAHRYERAPAREARGGELSQRGRTQAERLCSGSGSSRGGGTGTEHGDARESVVCAESARALRGRRDRRDRRREHRVHLFENLRLRSPMSFSSKQDIHDY